MIVAGVESLGLAAVVVIVAVVSLVKVRVDVIEVICVRIEVAT